MIPAGALDVARSSIFYRLDHKTFPWDKCVLTVKVGHSHTHRFDVQYYHSHFCTYVKTLLGVLCDSDAPEPAL